MNPFYRDETAVSSLQISSSTEQVTSTTVDVKFLVVSNLFDMPEKEDEQSLQYLHHVIGCKGAKELGSGAFATCYGGKIGKGHIFNVNPEQELAIKFYNKVEIDSRYVLELVLSNYIFIFFSDLLYFSFDEILELKMIASSLMLNQSTISDMKTSWNFMVVFRFTRTL